MAGGESGIVLRQIRTLLNEGRIGALADEQLLEQCATRRGEAAEAAFEALVLRHGPMVLGVCRRVLRDPHEVEDAFQATFLILARRAGSIRNREVLGGWLGKVAHRVAAPARTLWAPPRPNARLDAISSSDRPDELAEQDDLRIAILDEVQRLPSKYRLAVRLCYLEGRTHDEAARQLGWPVGTVRTRLAWARDRLRDRLTRRGLALPTGLIGAALVSAKASAEVPSALVKATVSSAAGRTVRVAVTTLTDVVLRARFMSKLKLAIVLCLAAGTLAGIVLPFSRAQVGKPGPVRPTAGARADGPQAEVQKDAATAREVETVFFRVVDQKTRQPLSGVILKIWIDGKMTRQLTTDDSGRMVIRLPEGKFERLTITARGDGLVPKRVYLRGRETEVPRSYLLAMERGTSIGGIVRDEQGRPIENVTVSLSENSPENRIRESFDFDEMSARTDAQGSWQLDLIPAALDLGRLHFRYSHPEFLSPINAVNIRPSEMPERLRKRSSVITLSRGIPITGRILDRDGRPIAGASVRLGDHPWLPTTKTETAGQFRIGNAPAGESFLTTQATGYAPEMRSVDVRPGFAPVEFRLGPGRTIRGRVIDSEGRPIVGAGVGAFQWRGHQTLNWRSVTDKEGRFRWDDAPSDAFSVSAHREGYAPEFSTIKPSDQEPFLVLMTASALKIRGTVTDAQTGRPIGTFTVVPGIVPGQLWLLSSSKVHHGGRYEFNLDALGIQPKRVRIEARGYLPVTSPSYPNGAGEKVFDARLSKGDWLEGVIRGTDGTPLSGAEVIVVTMGEGIHISGGKTYQRGYHPSLLTGSGGRFSFSPPDGPCRIIALHDQGYAEAGAAQLAKGPDLTIEPWGRIEGTLRVGGKPLAHESVIASLDDQRADMAGVMIQNESRTQTDDQGRFVFERVPRGEARIHWQPNRQGARTMRDRYYQPTFVDVLPGQMVHSALLVEGGRTLVGRVTAPESDGRPIELAGSKAHLSPKIPVVPYPPNLAEGERREWLHRWRFTETARNYRQRWRGVGHPLKLQADGSFRVDEVQPGDYELNVTVKGFAKLTRPVTIPNQTSNQDVGPVDLGVIQLKR
jgi:RNA polymerase sigma factor (sigma-70 family)